MKLLPPKPPKSAGTEGSVKQKEAKDKDNLGLVDNNLGDSAGLGVDSAAASTSSADDNSNFIPIDSVSPIESDNKKLDDKVSELESQADSSEKKKGFFSRIFKRKEKKDSVEFSSVNENNKLEDDMQRMDAADSDSKLDKLSSSVDETVKKESVGVSEDIFPAEDNEIPEPVNMAANEEEKYSKNKDQFDELPDFPEIAGVVYSKNTDLIKKDYSNSYAKDYVKSDYSKYVPKSQTAQSTGGSESTDWAEESGMEAIVESEEKKSGKSSNKKGKIVKSTENEIKKSPVLTSPNTESDTTDYIGQIVDWKEKAVSAASSKKTLSSVDMKNLDSRIKKMISTYESRLVKLANEKKKGVAKQINDLNKKIVELDKKEKANSAKEQKLITMQKSIDEKRKNVDVLVAQEKEFLARKESLKNEIDSLSKTSASLKLETSNIQKEYDSKKKLVLLETKKVQDSLKTFSVMYEAEKSKGERKLAELAKSVSETQAKLDELMKKSRSVTIQLKAKENAIQEKQKEVLELIEQEKRVLSIIKGNDIAGVELDVHKKRNVKEKKPATVIGFGGEPELYIDDEESLKEKISDCKDLVNEANYDDAKMLYNEIREEFMSAVLDDDAKKEIRHEINPYSR